MRTTIHIILLLLLVTIAGNAAAQQAKIGCMDKSIRLQGEQMKHDFKAQGMEIYKDAMLTMTPKQPYPIAIQLMEKELYQFIFVGSNNGGKLYFELFDGGDNKIGEKKVEVTKKNNYVIYSFIPQKTDLYLVVVSQKGKGKNDVCGSFTVMQKIPGVK